MSGRVLAALGLVVVALLGGLFFMIQDDGSPAEPTPKSDRTTARTDGSATTPAPTAPASPSARTTTIVPRTQPKRPTDHGAPSSSEPVAPAIEGSASEAQIEQKVFHRSLDEQIGITEPHLVECVEKATKSGMKVDGTTAVSFTIAKKPNGKLGIEATGVEYSSIPDQRTTDCIRDVGNSLAFEELPAGVDRVIAYRKVVVKDGKIVENWLTEFAQNPGQQQPPGTN